jgi:hypothetical protein
MTREEWLNLASAYAIRHIESSANVQLQTNVRFSCGFPGGRGTGLKAIGQCWPVEASADQTAEIFISPILSDGMAVLGTMVHELVHAIVGCKHGHKAPFKRVAEASGLTGKMTSTTETDQLKETMRGWLVALGDYPHAALSMVGRKKQSTRRSMQVDGQDSEEEGEE